MDRNSWIGILLIMAILFGWSYFTKPSQEEIAEQQRSRDSITRIYEEQKLKETLQKQEFTANSVITSDSVKDAKEIAEQNINYYGDFAPFAIGEQQFYTVQNNLLKVTFSNRGGRMYVAELLNYKTHDSLPLLLFDGDSTVFGLNFFAQNRNIATNQLFFKVNTTNLDQTVTDQPVTIEFSLPIDSSRVLVYTYTINPDSYVVDFNIGFKGLDKLIATNTGNIDLTWESYMRSAEKGLSWELQNTTVYYKSLGEEGDVDNLSERGDKESENIATRIKWISYKQQFFNVSLIADDYFGGAQLNSEKEVINPKYLKKFSSGISLPYSGKDEEKVAMKFYMGPNHYQTLKKLDLDLEELVSMGRSIIRWVNVGLVIPIFNWLGKFIGNYGLIILILTIIIKIIIFPFTYKSYISTAKMKVLKPEVDKLNEKFPKPEDAMKKQQATMEFYRKVGVNPLGGCLPLLFQMPVLIAMFRFFPNSIELRQEAFLWADDLSSYDAVINLPFTVPFGFGDHISLFCLLMTIINLIYIKTNDQMGASSQQIPGMKVMMYMMPVMMLWWFNSYASALSYYYFLSLLITMIQTWAIRKTVNDEEILAKLKAAQANKKEKKKSGFQQRLEDYAKNRGYQARK